MLLGDEEGVVKAITHLPPEAGTMGGDPASNLKMHVPDNVRSHFDVCVTKHICFYILFFFKHMRSKYFKLIHCSSLPTVGIISIILVLIPVV